MISDTLSEAIYDIRQYQRDMPEVYDSIKRDIDAVTSAMERLRKQLDAPPIAKRAQKPKA